MVNVLDEEEKKIIGEDIKTVQFGWPLGMPFVLLHGFIKKTQKIVKQDLDTSRCRMKEVKGGK